MSAFPLLRLGVLLSALYCVIALTILIVRTFSFGNSPQCAKARGSVAIGVFYAFGQGMLPWEKESAAKHLPTFFAGIFYHLGIFAALFYLIAVLAEVGLPEPAIGGIRLLLVVGLANGVGLLIKRVAFAYMRFISCPDDYVANTLVGLLLAAALLATFNQTAQIAMMILAIILILYIPAGKIRHCVFFFYSRILFGRFFGRRGVLPHPTPEV
jgi:nitrate reductase gamma subunit